MVPSFLLEGINMDYLKEVLVVEPSGEVLTNATEDDTIRHDILVGQIIQNYYDKDYQIKDSMLDNSKYACENFQDVIIMPDVTDLVALFREGTTKQEASYYIDNFLGEPVRVHTMQYKEGKYHDIKNLREFLYNIQDNLTR